MAWKQPGAASCFHGRPDSRYLRCSARGYRWGEAAKRMFGEPGAYLRDTEKRLRVDELRGDGGRDSRRRRWDTEVVDNRTVEERINDELPVDRDGRRTRLPNTERYAVEGDWADLH